MKLKHFFLALFFLITISVNAQNPTDFKLISATDNNEFVLSKAKGKYVALHFLLKQNALFV